MEQSLRPLLSLLASSPPPTIERWEGWRIERVKGGWNNLLFHATDAEHDIAVKFTVRDPRDRAGREYDALLTLHRAGLGIAPEPLLLDTTSYAQPVVVQSWLRGEVSASPPDNEAEWKSLLSHLACIHQITPETSSVRLRPAIHGATSVAEARGLVDEQRARLPAEARPRSLRRLMARFESTAFPDWPERTVTLCRVDNNLLNFVRRPEGWASVDWENSGLADPAMEIAEMVCHPAYLDIPLAQWEWVINAYADLTGLVNVVERIRVYCKILYIWWVGRMARYLYEIPRGLDQRLVSQPPGWHANMEAKYERYVEIAERLYV